MNYEKLLEFRKIVSERIEKEVGKDDFELSIAHFITIHERLFKGILYNNGHIRKHNIEKAEVILHDDSIKYPDYHIVPVLLKHVINKEKMIDYESLNIYEQIKSVVKFSAELWRIHPFSEGNTRTTCVFIEKYLKSLGFTVNNNYFKENADYYRNALVRANYENQTLGIKKDDWPLTKFYVKLLFDDTVNIDEDDLFIPKIKKRILNK